LAQPVPEADAIHTITVDDTQPAFSAFVLATNNSTALYCNM